MVVDSRGNELKAGDLVRAIEEAPYSITNSKLTSPMKVLDVRKNGWILVKVQEDHWTNNSVHDIEACYVFLVNIKVLSSGFRVERNRHV